MREEHGPLVPCVLHVRRIQGLVHKTPELLRQRHLLLREERVDIGDGQNIILSGGDRNGDIAVNGCGHVIARAHIEILEEGVQPPRRSEEVGRLIPDSLGMKPDDLGQSLSLFCQVLGIRIGVYLFAKVAINLRLAGFQDSGNLQRREWFGGYGELGQGKCPLRLV